MKQVERLSRDPGLDVVVFKSPGIEAIKTEVTWGPTSELEALFVLTQTILRQVQGCGRS